MKIPVRELQAKALLAAGVLLFAGALFDFFRPYLPDRPGAETIFRNIPSFPRAARTGRPPTAKRPPPAPAAARPRTIPPGGMLTTATYHNHGRYHGWVWAVKPGKKTSGRVKVEIAHAVAGEEGAFRIIAFADSTGDGKPDTEIARSGLLTGAAAGQWSAFEFETDQKSIFVGNSWEGAEYTVIYRDNGEWPLKDSPFEGRFYYSLPPAPVRSAGPAFTNMRINFLPQNQPSATSKSGNEIS